MANNFVATARSTTQAVKPRVVVSAPHSGGFDVLISEQSNKVEVARSIDVNKVT